MNKEKSLTRKQLVKLTGAKPYTIAYLKDCGKLPIVRDSKGIGYPTLYDPSSVEIVKNHIKKQLDNEN